MIEKVDATIRDFQDPITKEDIEELLDDDRVELIRPTAGYIPTKSDLRLLNDFFKVRPEVEFRVNATGLLQELELILLWMLSGGGVLTKIADFLNNISEGSHTRNHYRGVALAGALVCLPVLIIPFMIASIYKNKCLKSEADKMIDNIKKE